MYKMLQLMNKKIDSKFRIHSTPMHSVHTSTHSLFFIVHYETFDIERHAKYKRARMTHRGGTYARGGCSLEG